MEQENQEDFADHYVQDNFSEDLLFAGNYEEPQKRIILEPKDLHVAENTDLGYIEQKTKRFLLPKNYYMQVCKEGEATSCVNHLNSITPNVLHHAMTFYMNALESSRLKFETIKGEQKSSWEEAFISSCHGE